MTKKSNSSLLSKYLSLYEKDSNSRAFAPLAESYRRLGMYDEAYRVLKNGITKHPTYTLGYIILGKCYFDNEEFDACYKVIKPLIEDNRDNFVLLNVFGECCIKLGYLEDALDAYKMILQTSPKDMDAQEKVRILNEDLATNNARVEVPNYQSNFANTEDDWVHVSFAEKIEPLKPVNKLNYANEDEDPVLTLTLVDLYVAQGHLNKAIEIVEKFEDLHPSNNQIKQKKIQIQKLVAAAKPATSKFESSEESHEKLLGLVESKMKTNNYKVDVIKEKLDKFLFLLNKKSSQFV